MKTPKLRLLALTVETSYARGAIRSCVRLWQLYFILGKLAFVYPQLKIRFPITL